MFFKCANKAVHIITYTCVYKPTLYFKSIKLKDECLINCSSKCISRVFSQVYHLLPQEPEGPRVHSPHHCPSFLHLSTPMCSVLLPTLSSDKKAQDPTRMVHRATCLLQPCLCPCDLVSCKCLLHQGQLPPPQAQMLATTHQATTTQPPSKSEQTSPPLQQLEAAWQQVPALVVPPSLPNLRLSIQRRRSPASCPQH